MDCKLMIPICENIMNLRFIFLKLCPWCLGQGNSNHWTFKICPAKPMHSGVSIFLSNSIYLRLELGWSIRWNLIILMNFCHLSPTSWWNYVITFCWILGNFHQVFSVKIIAWMTNISLWGRLEIREWNTGRVSIPDFFGLSLRCLTWCLIHLRGA